MAGRGRSVRRHQPPQCLEPVLGEDHLPPNGFARLPKARTVMVRWQLCPVTPRLLGFSLEFRRDNPYACSGVPPPLVQLL